MTPRHTTTRHRDDDRWRCHGCGATRGLEVIRNEYDEDNYRLRIRRCRNCGELMATEESPISLDQFYARATVAKAAGSRKWKELKAARRKSAMRSCRFCTHSYHVGRFSQHVQTEEHLAALKTERTPRRREVERQWANRNYWRRRGIDIATASASVALAGA